MTCDLHEKSISVSISIFVSEWCEPVLLLVKPVFVFMSPGTVGRSGATYRLAGAVQEEICELKGILMERMEKERHNVHAEELEQDRFCSRTDARQCRLRRSARFSIRNVRIKGAAQECTRGQG